MREVTHPDRSDLQLTAVLHALSDPLRLAVVHQLASSAELNCSRLPAGRVSASTLTHHLRVLREAGVTHTRIAGREHHISLRREDLNARFPGLLEAVLVAAEADGSSAAASDAGERSASVGR